MFPKVIQVYPQKDYIIIVYFDDGKIKSYDCKKLISKGGIFKNISTPKQFIDLCTVKNGTVTWNISTSSKEENYIDICPDTIYNTGKDIADPFKKVAS